MNKKMTFEAANANLEEIVKNMENKGLTLQESVEQYAQACELLAYCMKELESCKGQIEDINERILCVKNEEARTVEN